MKKSYRNVAFLTELLINILVFSISCAVLAGMFGKAGEIARDTREESFAGTEVYALLETVRLRGVEGLPMAEAQADGSFVCRYDKNWQPTDDTAAPFMVQLQVTPTSLPNGVLEEVTAEATNAEGRVLCRFDTAVYRPREGVRA